MKEMKLATYGAHRYKTINQYLTIGELKQMSAYLDKVYRNV